ncbi:T9SS type A sorting domain-containing protein [Pedobacter arcticus]|uniref:T9SS type A sorting domain-containing protein n=1 Tax=Pedobacter arcticus TaxID=752140 RepID=UPI0003097E1B|nr:T9SS type A sorting domain-containing protein [Pedobacter arcticus]
MKKLLLFLLLLIGTLATQAQYNAGWDKAMNFGGAGADIEEMRYVNGDLYFVARMMGKYQFAGVNYDSGALGNYPSLDVLFGKITASGTQVLIQRFKSVDLSAVTFSSRISIDGSLYIFRLGFGAEKTFGSLTAPAYGLQLLKVSASGQFEFVKKVTTFSDTEFGTTGVANPNFYGMQVKDNGDIYAIFKSNTLRGSVYPTRVIKLDATGNEIWHYEMTSAFAGTSLAGIISNSMPRQFVDDNGNVTFKASSGSDILFNGETLPYEVPYTYGGQSTLRTWVVSLDNTGQKKWSTSTYVDPTFFGVNPTNGEIYINYSYGRQNPAVAASIAPFSSLPNLAPPPPFDYIPAMYSWSGIITLNTSGGIVKTKSNYANATAAFPTQMQMADNGRILLYTATANGNVFKAGNNFITFDGSGYAAMEVDADFNPLTVFKLPAGSAVALDNNKFAFGGSFKTAVTVGNTTLTPYFIDTDFNTRFPNWASIKADVLIAEGNLDNIPTELVSTKWLGSSTNWNDVANWSNGVPTAESKIVFDANVANMPIVATTPKAGVVVINAGVTASLPTALVITEKIINNGILSVNNALSYYSFTAYGAKAVEGDGDIFFNGTAAGAITYASLAFPTTNNSISLNHNIQFGGKVKNLNFLGTAALLTGIVEVTSTDPNAITGYGPTKHVRGKITRAVSPNGVYTFPTDNYSPYEPTTITLNNLTGTSKITVGNDYKSTAPDVSFASGKTTAQLGDYNWSITPDVAPTSGTYDVSFQKSEFTNGVTDAERYVVLKRKDKDSPWSFEGTKTASTQTGGTTSGQNISDATVTAGLTGLTSFSDFTIGVNSTAVPNNTSLTASTWTGSTNTEWNNAANWNNGVPTGTIDATIPAGLANYPAIYTAESNARLLTINTGVTGLKLHAGLKLTNGLINNSSIEIARLIGSETQFSGYGGGISGSGKIRFEANSSLIKVVAGVVNNDVEVNIGNANSINILGKLGGNINIISGLVNAWKFGSNYLEQTNPNSTIQITAPINAIAAEKLSKSVGTSGTYTLPLGDFQYHRIGVRKYGEVSITNNSIAAPSVYNVKFDSHGVVPVSFTSGSDVYTSFINSGQWFIEPTVFSTKGTIDLTLKTSNYTNGRASTNDYVLLRRASTTTGVTEAWVIVSGAIITETTGVITVNATSIAPFSINTMFCIGIKAGTTTWTSGAGTTDWNTAGNWSNGIPSATVKAVIGNALKYPNNAPTSGSAAAAIEIASGSVLTLPSSFYTPNGIVNNGTINVTGSGTFFGFGTGEPFSTLSGTGKLIFGDSAPATFDSGYMSSTLNNSVEFNRTGGVALYRTTAFTGDVNLVKGKITVGAGQTFNMTNPNATITSSTTSYIDGKLQRSVNPTGTYNFPVGLASVYAPTSLELNGLTGTSYITANFSTAAISGQPNLTIGTQTVTNVLATGSWFITPNAQPTGGTYSATLSAPIGSSTATNFYLLKREDNYSFYDWTNVGTNVGSSITAGIVTAFASGLTSFSQFGIGEGVGVLPVKMVKFLASADAKFAKLYWETVSELNNDKFEIERSTNGIGFIKIGEVKGNGTSQKLNVYNFKDLAPSNGVNYYRLKQVDLNGSFEYSETRAVKFDLKEVVFSIYPNPATEVINFSEAIKSVEIYSISGAKVYEQKTTVSTLKIPSKIKQGIYIINAILLDGSLVSKQVIIN